MTPQEIIEYNKRCAQFLCWKYNPETSIHFPKGTWIDKNNVGHCVEKGLRFHSDWNWIMEVVEAIEKNHAWVKIRGQAVDISTIANTCSLTKKEAVVQAINQFLIWYEKQKES